MKRDPMADLLTFVVGAMFGAVVLFFLGASTVSEMVEQGHRSGYNAAVDSVLTVRASIERPELSAGQIAAGFLDSAHRPYTILVAEGPQMHFNFVSRTKVYVGADSIIRVEREVPR